MWFEGCSKSQKRGWRIKGIGGISRRSRENVPLAVLLDSCSSTGLRISSSHEAASSPPPSAQLPFESWPTPPLVLHNLRYDVNQGRRIGNCSQANRSRICLIPGSLPCHHGEPYPGVCVWGDLLLLAPSFPRKSCVSLGNPYPAGGGKFKQLGSSAQIPTLLEFAILYTEVLSNWSPTSSISVTW